MTAHVSVIEPAPPTGTSTTSSTRGGGAIDANVRRPENNLTSGARETRRAVSPSRAMSRELSELPRIVNAFRNLKGKRMAHLKILHLLVKQPSICRYVIG